MAVVEKYPAGSETTQIKTHTYCKHAHSSGSKRITLIKNQTTRSTEKHTCKHTCGCFPCVKRLSERSNKTQHLYPDLRHTQTSRQHSQIHLHTLGNMQIRTLKTDIDSHAYLMPLKKRLRQSAWKWGKALVAVATETSRNCTSEK